VFDSTVHIVHTTVNGMSPTIPPNLFYDAFFEVIGSSSGPLIAGAAIIIGLLGLVHLWMTFFGDRLTPIDAKLQARMRLEPLVITSETNMWAAWIGFNTTHSISALLFSAVYLHLSLWQPAFLFASPFFLSLGLLVLVSYTVLGSKYFFSKPNRGIRLATMMYIAAILLM
jgi:hypothetical protein